ncbi:MAG: LCP family protein [bacterium]|nr:LCP family protein [bacterium]
MARRNQFFWKKSRFFGKKRTLAFFLAIVFFFLTATMGRSFFSIIRTTFASPDYSVTLDAWDGQEPLTVVVGSDPVRVFSYSPLEKRLIVVSIPGDTLVTVPYGYGAYRLKAVVDLGALDTARSGPELLMHSVQEFLAIPIDGYIDPGIVNQGGNVLENIRNAWKRPDRLLSSSTTTLKPLDIFRLFTAIAAVRMDRISFIDLSNAGITTASTRADGQDVLNIEQGRLDRALSENMPTRLSRGGERVQAIVLNGTGQEGLAKGFARYLEHLGAVVIQLGNAATPVERTSVVGLEGAHERYDISRILRPFCQEGCIAANGDVNNGLIVVTIGSDFEKFLSGASSR